MYLYSAETLNDLVDSDWIVSRYSLNPFLLAVAVAIDLGGFSPGLSA